MHKTRLTVLATVLTIVWSGDTGKAQNALDSNLQVGSGGVNQPDASGHASDFRNRNNVVSGVVGGGREFRSALSDLRDHGKTINEFDEIVDDLGQGGQQQWRSGHLVAPGAFRDELGTDELFRFRARSLLIGYIENPHNYTLGLQPVYSGGGTVSGDDIRRAINRRRDGVADRFWLQRRDATEEGREVPFFAPDTTLGRSGSRGNDMGELQLESGQIVALDATPLRGLRMTPMLTDSAKKASGETLKEEENPSEKAAPDTLDDSAVSTVIKDASVEIGRLIVATLDPRHTGAYDDPGQFQQLVEQHAIAIEQSLFGVETVAGEISGHDFYEHLLQRIEVHHKMISARADEISDEPEPTDEAETTVIRKVQLMLQNPTALQIRMAEEDRITAVQKALSLPESDHGAQATSKLDGPLGELIARLNTDVPVLPTMAGGVDERLNELFHEAESHMAEGRYLKAEQAYRQILEYRPAHKLAGAGLVHAQLGAGMIRSAAFNIRKLFSQHPQVITIRYEPHLLPGTERMAWVQKRLEAMLESVNLSEPAIVLAYLGYQAGEHQLVRYGLNVAQARAPSDPLFPLLRHIWIEENPDEDTSKPGEIPTMELEATPETTSETSGPEEAEMPLDDIEMPADEPTAIEATSREPAADDGSSNGGDDDDDTDDDQTKSDPSHGRRSEGQTRHTLFNRQRPPNEQDRHTTG